MVRLHFRVHAIESFLFYDRLLELACYYQFWRNVAQDTFTKFRAMGESAAVQIGCGHWIAFLGDPARAPPAIPCVPFTGTLTVLVAAVFALLLVGQLPFLPLGAAVAAAPNAPVASPLQPVGLLGVVAACRIMSEE